MRPLLRLLVLALCTSLLTACGFKLREEAPLPFNYLYTNISENSAFGAKLIRQLESVSPNTTLVDSPQGAQAQLIQISNDQMRMESSIDSFGQTNEYELTLRYRFKLIGPNGVELLPETTLKNSRYVSYDLNQYYAKEAEINQLFNEMQNRIIDQIIRRITSKEIHVRYQNALRTPLNP